MMIPRAESLWFPMGSSPPRYPRLEESITTDVLVIGGGITGLSAALKLLDAGRRVVLLEARTLGGGTTSRTTGHLTEVLDARYTRIEAQFGGEAAKTVAASCRDGIDQIEAWVEEHAIPCAFERLPGYLYSESADDADELALEQAAAARAGCGAKTTAVMPLPFASTGVRFEGQAQLDVSRYVRGLERAVVAKGARVHEGSRVVAMNESSPCIARLENGTTVRADYVFFATHAPLNRVFLQSKLVHYQSYVVAIRDVQVEPSLFWDIAKPYHYLRNATVDGVPYLLVGGEDHRTGAVESSRARVEKLMTYVRPRFGDVSAEFVWSARVIESMDGLPYIGHNDPSPNIFVATGFGGNGLTFGTLASMMLSDFVQGRSNPYETLYAATRVKSPAMDGFVGSDVAAGWHAAGDRVAPLRAASLDMVEVDRGCVVRVDGRRLAIYRDPGGVLHAVSAACTHLGCIVAFNDLERTWDCPCHGSRFGIDGAVIEGPAMRPLKVHTVEPVLDHPDQGLPKRRAN